MSSTIAKAINNISINYCSISTAAKKDLESCAQLLTFTKGTILVKEGQYSDKLYYIIKGAAKAYYLKDGKNIADWFAFENDFICALISYFTLAPSAHYIELLEDSELMMISRNDMLRLCNTHHDFERLGRVSTTKTMLQLQQRVVSLQFETAQQRYLNLKNIYPDIELRVPLGDIATFIGITQETLSRIRAANKRI